MSVRQRKAKQRYVRADTRSIAMPEDEVKKNHSSFVVEITNDGINRDNSPSIQMMR